MRKDGYKRVKKLLKAKIPAIKLKYSNHCAVIIDYHKLSQPDSLKVLRFLQQNRDKVNGMDSTGKIYLL